MNKRQAKKNKKRLLKRPRLAIRESGLLSGYTCPSCGNRYVKEPYCRNCNQMLIYEESQRKDAPLWKSNEEWEKAQITILHKYYGYSNFSVGYPVNHLIGSCINFKLYCGLKAVNKFKEERYY